MRFLGSHFKSCQPVNFAVNLSQLTSPIDLIFPKNRSQHHGNGLSLTGAIQDTFVAWATQNYKLDKLFMRNNCNGETSALSQWVFYYFYAMVEIMWSFYDFVCSILQTIAFPSLLSALMCWP